MLQETGLCAGKEQAAWDGAVRVEGRSICLYQPAGSEGYVTVSPLCQVFGRASLPPPSAEASLELDVVNETLFGSLPLQSLHREFLGNFPQPQMT